MGLLPCNTAPCSLSCKPLLVLHVGDLGWNVSWAHELLKKQRLNAWVAVTVPQISQPCNVVVSNTSKEILLPSVERQVETGGAGVGEATIAITGVTGWMFSIALCKAVFFGRKNPNPSLLRNHLRREMQGKINDRNEYSAVSQTEDVAWFSCRLGSKVGSDVSWRALGSTLCTAGLQHACDFSLGSTCTPVPESSWGAGLCHLHTFLLPSGQI